MYHVRNSLRPLVKQMRDSGADKNGLHEVMLIGCSKGIPEVHAMIQELFKDKEPIMPINSDVTLAFEASLLVTIFTSCGLASIVDGLLK